MKRTSFCISCLLALVILNSCSVFNHHTVATYNRSVSKAPFDVVIVPGLPYDTSKVNPVFKARLLWAKELYDNGLTKNIIFSGSAVHSPYIEGMIMKMMADSMGIPTRHTFIEDEALHSDENVKYGVALAHKLGFKNIAIATDPIQALVVKKYTEENHGKVCILPFSIKSMPVYYKTPVPSINSNNALVENFIPLKEREIQTSSIQD